jgi:chromosome segregation ATPase
MPVSTGIPCQDLINSFHCFESLYSSVEQDDIRRKNELLERNVDKLKLEVELLEKDAERGVAESQALRDEIVVMEDELGSARAQVVAAQEKAGASQRQVQRVDTDRRVLQEAVDQLKSELKDEMDGAEDARKQLAGVNAQVSLSFGSNRILCRFICCIVASHRNTRCTD